MKNVETILTHITVIVSRLSAITNFAKGVGRRRARRTTVRALVFVEYEVTYRIHYRTGVRSMHAKVEKQAQLVAGDGRRGEGGWDERTDGRTGG